MKRKIIIKTLIFLTLVFVIFFAIFRILWLRDNVYSREVFDQFYELPKNSTDVILIGSSGIREYYNAAEAFQHNGLSSYALATGNQPFAATKYIIEEANKTQNPSVYVIDIRQLILDGYDEGAIRRTSDAMNFSKTRFDLLNCLLDHYEDINPDIEVNRFDYYFSFTKYHSRWEDVKKDDFVNSENEWMGFSIYNNIEPFEGLEKEVLEAAPVAISKYNEAILYDLLDYCKTIDGKVVFINVPSLYDKDTFGKFNYIKNIISKSGFEILDLNYCIEDMEIDYKSDFKNYYHVNVWGALKFSDYLSDYLMTKYDLKSHSDDDKYNIWRENYNSFSKSLLTSTNTIDKYFEIMPRYKNELIVISAKDDASSGFTELMKNMMEKNGLNGELKSKFRSGYIGIINNSKKIDEEIGKNIKYEFSNNGKNVSVISQGYDDGNISSIMIDGVEYSNNKRGLNIVIYDNKTNELLDSVTFDTCGSGEVFR